LGHIRTDTSSERENKTKAELKVHSQTAGSKVEEEQQTTTVGSWSTSHSSAMKSLKYDQQTSTSGSLKHEYAANPGESIQLFQLIFTCGGHKIRLKQTEQNVVRWDKHDASGQLVLPEPLQLPKG
jgi:predicted amidophosphoribosyltransferase